MGLCLSLLVKCVHLGDKGSSGSLVTESASLLRAALPKHAVLSAEAAAGKATFYRTQTKWPRIH